VQLRGHAIEARVYAEDPEEGFLPATGRIELLRWPDRDGVRVDAGIREGDRVLDRYDPMLAKVIAHGATRDEARRRLIDALGETRILGVRTNLRFLRWLLQTPEATTGEIRTDTIAGLRVPPAPVPDDAAWEAAGRALLAVAPPSRGAADERGPWGGGWRLNGAPMLRLRSDGEERTVAIAAAGGGEAGPAVAARGGVAHVDVEGRSTEFTVAPAPTVEEAVRHAAAETGFAALVAPMPGRVIAIRAALGAAVQPRDPVVFIEAMKMEHAVTSPIAGTVSSLAVREGQQVQRGDLLAEVSA
jgi:acetyl/propionyl-CoA carboxylase alpha subunit